MNVASDAVALGAVLGVEYNTRSVYAAGLLVSRVVDPCTYLYDLQSVPFEVGSIRWECYGCLFESSEGPTLSYI